MAEKTFERRQRDAGGRAGLAVPRLARTRSPRSSASCTRNYFWTRSGLPVVKARFQNVYGPGEVLGAGRWRGTVNTVWRNVTPTFVWKALHGEALPLDNGGIATRDFIYVGDMAEGLIACAERGEPGGVYNLASGVETSDPRAGRDDRRARRHGHASSSRRRATGTARASASARPRSPSASWASARPCRCARAWSATIAWTREQRGT